MFLFHCPQKKIKGEYCNSCEPYGKMVEERIDKARMLSYNENMKKRPGMPAKAERNIKIYHEHKQGASYSVIMAKYGFRAKSTVSQIINRIAQQEKQGLIKG